MDFETRAFKYQNSINRGGKGDHVTLKEAPAEPRTRSKKDTKKWCKGVVGREHNWVWIYRDILPNTNRVRGGVFKEPPLPTVEEEESVEWRRQNQWSLPRAANYCTICSKQREWWTNSFDLRRKGIPILTKLPSQE